MCTKMEGWQTKHKFFVGTVYFKMMDISGEGKVGGNSGQESQRVPVLCIKFHYPRRVGGTLLFSIFLCISNKNKTKCHRKWQCLLNGLVDPLKLRLGQGIQERAPKGKICYPSYSESLAWPWLIQADVCPEAPISPLRWVLCPLWRLVSVCFGKTLVSDAENTFISLE